MRLLSEPSAYPLCAISSPFPECCGSAPLSSCALFSVRGVRSPRHLFFFADLRQLDPGADYYWRSTVKQVPFACLQKERAWGIP